MSEEKKTNNPARYREMAVPHESREKLMENTKAFQDAIEEARLRFRMRDVVVIAQSAAIGEGGEEGDYMSTMMLGDTMKALPLTAYLYGKLRNSYEEQIAAELAGKKRK